MVGIIYAVLCIAALLFWRLESPYLCVFCSESVVSGLFERSWYLWGSVYYAVAALLCSTKKNPAAGLYLVAGAVFHLGLVAYGYFVYEFACALCLGFAALGTGLAVLYYVLPEGEVAWKSPVSRGLLQALAVVALILLLANPSPKGRVAPDAVPLVAEQGIPVLKVKEAEASCYLEVSTADGKELCLNLREKPALFFAAWCPHCDEALKEVVKLEPEKRPYLVVTYLRGGDVEKAAEKLAKAGLTEKEFYLAEKPPAGLQGVPALVVWRDGRLEVEGDLRVLSN